MLWYIKPFLHEREINLSLKYNVYNFLNQWKLVNDHVDIMTVALGFQGFQIRANKCFDKILNDNKIIL